jgi:hypothetical protein
MSTIVDTQIAGGSITVDHGRLLDYDPAQPIIAVDFPGGDVLLFPHEARDLVNALISTLEATERQRTLRRNPEVDERLREVEGL